MVTCKVFGRIIVLCFLCVQKFLSTLPGFHRIFRTMSSAQKSKLYCIGLWSYAIIIIILITHSPPTRHPRPWRVTSISHRSYSHPSLGISNLVKTKNHILSLNYLYAMRLECYCKTALILIKHLNITFLKLLNSKHPRTSTRVWMQVKIYIPSRTRFSSLIFRHFFPNWYTNNFFSVPT